MKIALIFRSKERKEFSIENLFHSLVPYFKKENIVNEYYLPCGRYTKIRYFLKNISYAKSIESDIYHITGEVFFLGCILPKEKLVITLHDFVNLEQYKGMKKKFSWLFWNYIPFKRAKKIICISPKVMAETIHRFPFTKDKVIFIPNPIDDSYEFISKKFNEEKPKIFAVGTRTNKNLERIILAIKNINCELMILGKLSNSQIQLLNENLIQYKNYYNLNNDEVKNLYISCDLVVFPSTYEGFGRPIIEAQSIGRPVITSNIAPMNEISSEENACLVDPYDVSSIENGIEKVIGDENYRNSLIKNGLDNAKIYRASIVASKYNEIYNNL